MAKVTLTAEDWREARRLYEEDGWDVATIADYFGCAVPTVYKRSGGEKWIRPSRLSTAAADMAERRRQIQDQAAQDLELQVARNTQLRLDVLVGQAREQAIVEANAQEVSRVMMLHRVGATRLRETLASLFAELQLISLPQGSLDQLVELVVKAQSQDIEDERESRRVERETLQAFRDLLGLGNRADIAKKLVDSMIKAVELERKVYGIRDEVTEGDVAKALRELAESHD